MNTFLAIVSACLAIVALVFLAGNYALLVRFVFSKKHGSLAFPIGGITGMISALLVPGFRKHGLFLLPLVLDPGTWALVCSAPFLIRELVKPRHKIGSTS